MTHSHFKIAFALGILIPNTLARATPPLVLRYASDVPGALIRPNSSNPTAFTVSPPNVYFAATTPELGTEPWVFDGVSAHVVKDIVPGSARSMSNIIAFAPLSGGRAVFLATDTLGIKNRIWVTDGTDAGTHPLVSNTGYAPTAFYQLAQSTFGTLPGRVLFDANDANGFELWSTDGTDAGTAMVADLTPGFSDSYITFLHTANSLAYFLKNSTLWRTDGTAAGTFQLGAWSSVRFLSVGSTTYFISSDTDSTIRGIWITDGTGPGTHRILDAPNTTPELGAIGAQLLFNSSATATATEPWVYNPLTSTASPLADIYPGATSSLARAFTPVAGRSLFFAIAPGIGYEPWITDGTPSGTTLLADLSPASPGSLSSTTQPVSAGALAFFLATPGGSQPVLFATSGQPGNAIPLSPANSPSAGPIGVAVPDGSGRFIFQGADPVIGNEPFITDGTIAGTHPLMDIAAGGSTTPISASLRRPSNQQSVIARNGDVFFPSITGSPSSALVTASAAPNSAAIVHAFRSGPSELGLLNNRLFFPASDATGFDVELWSSDGGGPGTSLLADIGPGFSSTPRSFTRLGNKLFFVAAPVGSQLGPSYFTLFSATDTASGVTQVVSNTIAGIPRVRFPSASSIAPAESLTAALGKLFFVASTNPTSETSSAAYVSDGTDAGTIALASVQRTRFVEFRNRVYFIARDSFTAPTGLFLISTDGTLAGTTTHAQVTGSSMLLAATSSQIFLYLPDASAVNNQLAVFTPDTNSLTPITSFNTSLDRVGVTSIDSAVLNDRLIFAASDGISGSELWSSDGTSQGTTQLADLVPGSQPSNPNAFIRAGNTVFFLASPPNSIGSILYQTNGTPTGTLPVPVAPGSPPLSPFAFTAQSFAPTENAHRIFAIAANPTAQQVWYFDICPADFDASGDLSINDIFSYLNAWFARDPHADTNASGDLTPTDILDFIDAWFAGCD